MPRSLRSIVGLILAVLLAGCESETPKQPTDRGGPIVLISFEGLRDDAITGLGGEPGLTPKLAVLLSRAPFHGRAIAASGRAETSIASLMTGLQPWQHQILAPGSGTLPAGVLTLAEAVHAAGYRTYGFASGREDRLGLGRGFDEFGDLGKGRTAADRLSRLSGRRELVWIHLSEPRPPFVRRDWLLARLPGAPTNLPRRLSVQQIDQLLERGAGDPEVVRKLGAMYRSNVAWADERLGRLLQALDASGQRERTLLVVTSVTGEDFGPGRIGGRDGGLGRQILEVPLVVELPKSSPHKISNLSGQPVALTRIWATIAEAAGLAVPPAVAPSLFRATSAPILSEQYAGEDGTNRFSLLTGSDQLLWQVAFAPGDAPAAAKEAAFADTPPLHGHDDRRTLRLLRWGPMGSRGAVDPAREAALALELERAWSRFVPEELSPREEARRRGLRPLPVASSRPSRTP